MFNLKENNNNNFELSKYNFAFVTKFITIIYNNLVSVKSFNYANGGSSNDC